MVTYRTPRVACIAACAVVGWLLSATEARAQATTATPPNAAALSTAAAKASPELVNGLAKELGATPEQAAGVAGLLFSLTKAFTTPENFAAMSKAVPGMDALLAATPTNVGVPLTAPTRSMLTPGIASASTTGTMAAADGMAAAGMSNLGFEPGMIMKALSFVWQFITKYGGAALGAVFDGLFKGAGQKPAQ